MIAPAFAYVPGDWSAAAAPGSWLLVDAAPSTSGVHAFWRRMARGLGPDEILDALLSSGLAQARSFAMVIAGDPGIVLVRGAASAQIHVSDKPVQDVLGTTATTWAEATLHGPLESIVLSGASGGSGAEVPAASGVFPARSVILRWSDTSLLTSAPSVDQVSAQPSEDHHTRTFEPQTVSGPSWEDADGPGFAVAAAEVPTAGTEPPNYDHLFGVTQQREVEGAAKRDDPELPGPPEPSLAAPAAASEPTGRNTGPLVPLPPDSEPALIDFVPGASSPDGLSRLPASQNATVDLPREDSDDEPDVQTVARSSLPTAPQAVIHDRIGPMVHAVRCSNGHLNPPVSASCRCCGIAIPHQEAVSVPRPSLGALVMSSGDSVTLDRGVLLGRSPDWDGEGEERPHLVQVNNELGDISRNHVQVTLDGWHVLVADLRSTNGTLLSLPGEEPQRLRAQEPVPIEPGSEVILADGVSFRYEVTP